MLGRTTLALVCLTIAGAGCGGDDEETTTAGATGATGTGSATDAVAGADADAKVDVRNAQVALEVYATENNGSYAGANEQVLAEIDPSLADAEVVVLADKTTYDIKISAPSGAVYSINRDAGGKTTYSCDPPGTGDCPENGDWGSD